MLVRLGQEPLSTSDKTRRIRALFDAVTPVYDGMNDWMSLGLHRLWKDAFVRAMNPRTDFRLLDLAGGTGDITWRWLASGGGEAVLADSSLGMLARGRDRLLERGFCPEVVQTVGEALPFRTGSFQRIALSFGLRNMSDMGSVLTECHRVLEPLGCLYVLEFSTVEMPVLSELYPVWRDRVIPFLGARVAGNRAAYAYLARSIRHFPSQDLLRQHMLEAGFVRVTYQNLAGGIAAIHRALRV